MCSFPKSVHADEQRQWAPLLSGGWPAPPWPGVCWGTAGPCGLWGYCAIIPCRSPQTPGCRELRPCLRHGHPHGRAAMAPKPPGTRCHTKASLSSRLAASLKPWARNSTVSPAFSGALFLAAYFHHDLLYCPSFHLAKGENNISLLQLHLLCFSTTGFNQLKL